MFMLELIFVMLAGYALFWSAYVLALPSWAELRKHRLDQTTEDSPDSLPSIAVLIPAHNMEVEIEQCIASLHGCGYPDDMLNIWVIADHCTDGTATQANASGAEVLIRDEVPPGKSYAIAWSLDQLATRGADPDLYVIVDATVEVHPGFLAALAARWRVGEDIVVGHAFVDPTKQQWFVRCMGLTLAHRRLQNYSRERLGLSSLIEGRGMAYSRHYIKRFGWRLAVPDSTVGGSHPTEDWRHGVRAVANGFRVSFADDARVYTPLRGTLAAASKQGLRWERGRIGNAMTHGLALLRQGIGERNRLKIYAALDSIQPPVAVLGGLSVGVVAGAISLYGVSMVTMLMSSSALVVGCYALLVIARGRRDGIALWTLLWAPVYLAWRCLLFVIPLVRLDRILRGRQDGREV